MGWNTLQVGMLAGCHTVIGSASMYQVRLQAQIWRSVHAFIALGPYLQQHTAQYVNASALTWSGQLVGEAACGHCTVLFVKCCHHLADLCGLARRSSNAAVTSWWAQRRVRQVLTNSFQNLQRPSRADPVGIGGGQALSSNAPSPMAALLWRAARLKGSTVATLYRIV